MCFYTDPECEEWITGCGLTKPDIPAAKPSLRLTYPSSSHRLCYWAYWIAATITNQNPCLLWIAEWGIWPSSENLHLYYRFRQSYGDLRLLHEAPGHFFLGHESADLASFLQVAMTNGWGGFLLPARNCVKAFFSHDEYMDFYFDDESLIDQIRSALIDTKPN